MHPTILPQPPISLVREYLLKVVTETNVEAPPENLPDRYRDLLTNLSDLNQAHGPQATHAAWETLQGQFPELQSPPTGYPLAALVEDNLCPELPQEARPDFSLADNAGSWIDTYTDYAQQVSPMTPLLFHQSAALWLASTAIARRLKIEMSFGSVYPNLFIHWIAPTTIWSKSTGLKIAHDLAQRVFPHLLAPQDTTPEAMMADMSGREPAQLNLMDTEAQAMWKKERDFAAQRGWIVDEASGLLAGSHKDYNAGLLEFIMQGFDCTPQFTRSTRQQGRVTVRSAYLSLLANSTPAALHRFLTDTRLWSMGWWPRFALLTPETAFPQWKVPKDHPVRTQAFIEGVSQLYNRLPVAPYPTPPSAETVLLGVNVHATWERYAKAMRYDQLKTGQIAEQLNGSYGRLPVHALKVAMLLAALDWQSSQTTPTIELPHIVRGIQIAEQWRASLHRTLALASQSNYDRIAQRIIGLLGKHLDGVKVAKVF